MLDKIDNLYVCIRYIYAHAGIERKPAMQTRNKTRGGHYSDGERACDQNISIAIDVVTNRIKKLHRSGTRVSLLPV